MCSYTPNPKFPDYEKHPFLNSNSLTFKPFSNNYSAFSPLTVTWVEIFSFLFIPKVLIVNLAFEYTGSYSDISYKTFAAFVNLSPDSPTHTLITNLSIFISFIGFSFVFSAIYP